VVRYRISTHCWCRSMDGDPIPSGYTYRRYIALLLLLIVSLTLVCVAGCSGGRRHAAVSGEGAANAGSERRAEAFLFDTEIHYKGKYSSVRLELYATDSIVGIGGRSYLGKGALDGWLTRDSVKLLFPSSNEFVHDAVILLLRSLDCSERGAGSIDLLSLLYTMPSVYSVGPGIVVSLDSSDVDRPAFELSSTECPWRIDLIYDAQAPGWRVREFTFTNGDNLSIKAKRREYKPGVKAKSDKFTVEIPPDAVRISP
jgi:hypothetical protein